MLNGIGEIYFSNLPLKFSPNYSHNTNDSLQDTYFDPLDSYPMNAIIYNVVSTNIN